MLKKTLTRRVQGGKQVMFSLLRLLLFMLIITFLLGCGEDELVVPTVTVEFLGYEAEEAQFELNAVPTATTELAVLLTFTSDNRDSFHIWAVISKGSHKEVFTVPLDRYVFWDVKILPLEGINLNDYPISDFEISVGRFNGYVLGDQSKATTGPDKEKDPKPQLMKSPFNVTDKNFTKLVMEPELPVVVYFWADWCPPCQWMAPIIKEVASENRETFLIAKLDTDRNPQTIQKYRIEAIPTFIVFQNGNITGRFVGGMQKAPLVQRIRRAINAQGN